jgi:hypothetical protein
MISNFSFRSMQTMKTVLFSLIVFLLVNKVYGQSKFYPTLAVTISNDTIEGFISYSKMKQSPSKITFLLRQDDFTSEINQDKIALFKFQNSDNQFLFKTFEIEKFARNENNGYENTSAYRSRQKIFKKKSAFIKQISKGEVNLYEFIDDDNVLYLLVEYKGKIEELVFHTVYTIKGIIQFRYFEVKLNEILQKKTCMDFNSNYFLNLNYNVKDIESLIDKYNICFATPEKPKSEVIQQPKETILPVIKVEQTSHLNTEINKVSEQNKVQDKKDNIVFFADKDSLELGTSTFINWDIPNEENVVLSYSLDNTNFEIISNSYFRKGKHRITPKSLTFYRISYNNTEKIIKINVKLPIIKKPLIEYFYFEKDEVKLGESTTLKWSVLNAKEIILETSINGINWSVEENTTFGSIGEKLISPKRKVFYRIVADTPLSTLILNVN